MAQPKQKPKDAWEEWKVRKALAVARRALAFYSSTSGKNVARDALEDIKRILGE